MAYNFDGQDLSIGDNLPDYNFANHSTNEHYEYFSDPMKKFILFLYIGIAIVSIGGNALVIFLILVTKSLRTVTNTLIVNQSVSGIMMTSITIPYYYFAYALGPIWRGGVFLCKFGIFNESALMLVIVFTLVVLCCDRCRAVIYPLRQKPTMKCICILCLVMWIVAVLMSMPLYIFTGQVYAPEGIFHCVLVSPNDTAMILYLPAIQFFEYYLPLIVLLITYGRIWWEIRKSGREISVINKKKSVTMLMMIAILHMICWFPWNIMLILMPYLYDLFERTASTDAICFLIFHMLGMSSLCMHPIVYFAMNVNFREALPKVFTRTCNRRSDGGRPTEACTNIHLSSDLSH